MAMFENFPYTDMHNLNLDWIIKIAKDFLDQYTHIQELIANGEESLQNLTAEGLQQLQDKADALETLLNEWYNTHSADIADQLTDALADLNAWYNTHQGYLNQYLQDSISNFNTAAETKAAQTIATIPDDYTALFNRVDRIKTGLFDSEYETTYVDGYINNSGVLTESAPDEDDITSDYIPVFPGFSFIFVQEYEPSAKPWLRVAIYDINKNFVRRDSNVFDSTTRVTYTSAKYTPGADARYIRISTASRQNSTTYNHLHIFIRPSYSIPTTIKLDHSFTHAFSDLVIESGNRPRILIEADGTSGLTVYVPNRLFIFGENDILIIWDNSSGASNYYVPHNSYLVYNFNAKEVQVISESNYVSLNKTENIYIVLLFSSYGKALGQWGRYQQNETDALYQTNNFRTIEFVNRQGQVMIANAIETPENSLIGCSYARRFGYNSIRISIEMTSDNIPVAFHDAYLGSNGKVYLNGNVVTANTKISDLTYNQLLAYDFGYYANAKFENTRIATFDQHIEQARKMGYELVIELKEGITPMTNTDFDNIHSMICKYGMKDNVKISAYRITTLNYFKSKYSKYQLIYNEDYLTTATIDTTAALYNGSNNVYIFALDAKTAMNDTLKIYASEHNVKTVVGSAQSSFNISTYANRFDCFDIAYINYPTAKLIP